jgi:hypothetical protein
MDGSPHSPSHPKDIPKARSPMILKVSQVYHWPVSSERTQGLMEQYHVSDNSLWRISMLLDLVNPDIHIVQNNIGLGPQCFRAECVR